jgi:hypothetical protein
VRLFYKVLDQHLRAVLFGPEPPGTSLFHQAQAGFTPGRSGHEQATILKQIASTYPAAYAAFLDIEKAFDSFGHAHLLDILQTRFSLDPQWLEVLRRLLPNNTTTVMGCEVQLGQGIFQGTSLSPTLCLGFLQDLAVALGDHIKAHPKHFPPPPYFPRSLPHHVVLAYLFLFADDIGLLARSAEALRSALACVSEWAARRRVRLSPKSFVTLLEGNPALLDPLPSLPVWDYVKGFYLRWESEEFPYLGVPMRPYRPRAHRQTAFAVPDKVSERCGQLHALLPPVGASTSSPTAVTTALTAYVYSKALYATPVVDIDYQALDSLIGRTLVRLCGLPPGQPYLLVYAELSLAPSAVLANVRALRFLWRLVHNSWFIKDVLFGTWATGNEAAWDRLTSTGPLQRLNDLLYRFRDLLWAPGDPTDRYAGWLAVQTATQEEWYSKVTAAASAMVRTWYEDKLSTYKPSYQAYLRRSLSPWGSLPRYIRVGGTAACAGLRFKRPALRPHIPGEPLPQCAHCLSPDAESGAHLLVCPALPAADQQALAATLQRIAHDLGPGPAPAQDILVSSLLSLTWRNQSDESVQQALQCLRQLNNSYRLRLPGAPDGSRPVWFV